MARYQPPRGTRDFLPAEMVVRNHVERTVRATFESYGFQEIQTPTFEQYELLAARSGEEIKESMFTFASDAGRYALRPELTSPVCRLVASDGLRQLPRPYKLYYLGPCFRYCRPQPGRYREFYQAGVELMGSPDPLADAEVIAVAVKTLTTLGVRPFRLKVGDVGVFRRLLQEQGQKGDGQQQERQNHVISGIDRIMHVREKCAAFAGRAELSPDDRAYLESVTHALVKLQDEISYPDKFEILARDQELAPDKLRERLARLPEAAEATYRAAWVAQRLLPADKADLLVAVSRIRGSAGDVLQQARSLLAGTPALEPLDDLAKVCGWLEALGVADFELVLGTARNLDFYTGTVFEIDSPLLGAQKQLCGGGRYDKLVEEFDGPATPATGFAFGFDRLVEAFKASGHQVNAAPVDVVVVSPAPKRRQALEAAERLRAGGLRVGVDLREQADLNDQMDYGKKLDAEFAVVVGLDDLGAADCKLRQRSGAERTVPLKAAAEEIQRTLRKGQA